MTFISYEQSQKLLNALHVKPMGWEKIFLSDALGRILAEDIVAQFSSPEFETSAMDGYAIKADDQKNGTIKMLGDNPAGSELLQNVTHGYCIKTFTGSKMPNGADTLIQIENVEVQNDEITINKKVIKGANVRKIGESYSAGDILIKKCTKLSFVEIGVLAGLNRVMIKVVVKPKVAVLSTGSEILDIAEDATTSTQIRSSNNYTIEAMMRLAGADVKQLGVVKDDKNSIINSFNNALHVADIIITTGGVSVGDYDFVKDIVPALGAEIIFKGVKIKPGQHILLATKDNKFIISLPGFAYSSTVTAWLYAVTLVRRLQLQNDNLVLIDAILKEPFIKKSKKTEFTACNITLGDGKYMVDFNGKKSGTSAILTNLLQGSALMVTFEDDVDINKGKSVKVIMLSL